MRAPVREFSSRIVPDVAVWTPIGRLAMTNKITVEVILCGEIAKRSGCRPASMNVRLPCLLTAVCLDAQ